MAGIYHNSYLTLAATCAADGSGGLFSRKHIPEKIIKETSVGTETKVVVRQVLNHMGGAGDKETTEFPLLTRAWAYQERILAPRIVHFCEDNLIWECNELRACECGSDYGYSDESKKEHWEVFKYSKPGSADHQHNFFQRWQNIVEEYTELHLINSSDLLPALSGLARQMGALRQSKYLASL